MRGSRDRAVAEVPLEWAAILNALEKRAATSLGRRRLRALGPLPDRAAVERSLATIEEARQLAREGSLPRLGGVEEIEPYLTHAEKDGVLEAEELVAIGHTLEAIAEAAEMLRGCAELAPLTHAIVAEIGEHWPLARAIARTFDAAAQIVDDASADLGPLRKRAASLRDEIKVRLGELLGELDRAEVLQESYYTLRGDRYVVPVRSDRRGQVSGLVHDTSQSGQTLFIEPQPLIDIGNRLKIAEAEVTEEERRILRRLTGRIVGTAAQIRDDLDRVAVLDALFAKARLTDALGAEPPEIVEGCEIDLRRARHPILVLAAAERPVGDEDGIEAVPNDISLGGDARVLVLSGPNAGGKTVALKTVGLCALMLRAGLPIPALGSSRLGLFERIHAVIGDAQSIDAQLSTFSAHVLAIDSVVRDVTAEAAQGRPTLCLIDEIAQGTDPTQGASLAQAFLEALATLGALVVATTHHERLKALALDDQRFRNASVALDPDTLRPTFELHLDVPGASSAFAIAAALGVEEGVVARARHLAGPEASQLEKHVEQLAEERERLARARKELEEARATAEAERARMEGVQQSLRERERRLTREARESLLGDVRRARREVAEVIAGLQGHGDPTLKKADAAAHALKEIERRAAERAAASAPKDDGLGELTVGQRVHVPRLGQDGEVIELHGRDACTVQCGALRTRARRDELSPPSGSSRSARSEQRRTEASSGKGSQKSSGKRSRSGSSGGRGDDGASEGRMDLTLSRAPRTAQNTLDLRGQRVDEAIENVERFLDTLTLRGEPCAYLLHGHGTGALRRGLREQLPRSGYARAVEPAPEDEGGDAFTVVELE